MKTKHGTGRLLGGVSVAAWLAASAGVAGVAQSGDSQARQSAPYGCACLHNNKVNTTIKFRYRWGERDWNNVSLAPGRAQWMCWTYRDAPKSPELLFQLDVDMTDRANWQTFAIKRAQSREQSCAAIPSTAQYHVGYVAGSNRKKIRIFTGKQ